MELRPGDMLPTLPLEADARTVLVFTRGPAQQSVLEAFECVSTELTDLGAKLMPADLDDPGDLACVGAVGAGPVVSFTVAENGLVLSRCDAADAPLDHVLCAMRALVELPPLRRESSADEDVPPPPAWPADDDLPPPPAWPVDEDVPPPPAWPADEDVSATAGSALDAMTVRPYRPASAGAGVTSMSEPPPPAPPTQVKSWKGEDLDAAIARKEIAEAAARRGEEAAAVRLAELESRVAELRELGAKDAALAPINAQIAELRTAFEAGLPPAPPPPAASQPTATRTLTDEEINAELARRGYGVQDERGAAAQAPKAAGGMGYMRRNEAAAKKGGADLESWIKDKFFPGSR